MIDLLIKNGLIIDGTASPSFKGDVAVNDGKILEIAPHIDVEAKEVLDAEGLCVSPGFIDMHSHSDSWFMVDDKCEAKIYQGVTSEVVGNCGSSQFPRNVEDTTKVNRLREEGKLSPMGSYQAPDFFKLRTKRRGDQKMSTNLIQLVGHNAIRRGVVGMGKREAWEDEIKLEEYLLQQALDQGCWGMSMGLEYLPGRFAGHDEIVRLAKLCYVNDVIVTVHMKNEGETAFESLRDMIDVARESGCHMHISHFKLCDKTVWGKSEEYFNMLLKAREEGVNITCDMYPYNACQSGLANRLPDWALDGGHEAACRMLEENPEKKAIILKSLQERFPDYEDGDMYFIASENGHCPEMRGKTVGQLAKMWGLSNPEGMLEAMLRCRLDDTSIITNMKMDDVLFFLSKDMMTIGSDASCRPFDPKYSEDLPHPRSYGTFPRFLKLAREHAFCSMETAVHRITQLPAQYVGLKDRGVLEAGKVADICVFDWNRLNDNATYEDPFQKCDGIEHVIMNGKFAIRNAQQTEERLGDYILR